MMSDFMISGIITSDIRDHKIRDKKGPLWLAFFIPYFSCIISSLILHHNQQALKKLFIVLGCLVYWSTAVKAQTVFSLGTNFSVFHNASPQQKFWTLGQFVEGYAHFSKKESAYAWFNYTVQGKFKNTFTAVAKDPQTVPPSFDYTITSRWRFNQFSLGWKHYFKGAFDNEDSWNLYGMAGFGLLYTHINNEYNNTIDTALYTSEKLIYSGSTTYKKLTFDLGLGVDYPIGGDLFVYGDLRAWLPASDKTSPYLINNKNVPLTLIGSVGLRVMFGFDY